MHWDIRRHWDIEAQGEFNRSSQHLVLGGTDRQARWVDMFVDGAIADEVCGCVAASAGD